MGGSRLRTEVPETLRMVMVGGANQGHRSRRWPVRLSLGHPDHRVVGIRPALYLAVAWMASLCIREADLILQEMLTRR
jgi:hypothetical protein